MLYYLFQWLDKYDFPGAGMFRLYIFQGIDGYHPGIAHFEHLG